MRSLIQLAVRAHRNGTGNLATPNILVITQILRCFTQPDQPAFCNPGFETNSDSFHLKHHDPEQLIAGEDLEVIDARPCIVSADTAAPRPRNSMVNLEDGRMRIERLTPQPSAVITGIGNRTREAAAPSPSHLNATTWWQQVPYDDLLTAVLQLEQPFRKATVSNDVTLVWLPDEGGEAAVLHRVPDETPGQETLYERIDLRFTHLPDALIQRGAHRALVRNGLHEGSDRARHRIGPELEYVRASVRHRDDAGQPQRWFLPKRGHPDPEPKTGLTISLRHPFREY